MPEFHKAIASLMDGRRTPTEEAGQTPTLRAVLHALARHLSKEDVARATVFARLLFQGAGAATLATEDSTRLAAMVAGAYRFICDYGTDPVAVRVFAPSAQEDGWTAPGPVIQAILGDRPFIVDTLQESVQEAGGDIRLLLHPRIGVRGNPLEPALEIGPPNDAAARKSFVFMVTAGVPTGADLQRKLRERLESVVRVTDDYAAMRARMAAISADLRHRSLSPGNGDAAEVAAFLDWLGDKNFVFLGMCAGGADPSAEGRTLGIAASLAGYAGGPEHGQLRVRRVAARSPVHRLAPIDVVDVASSDDDDTDSFFGLFTAHAYHEPASVVPVCRARLLRLLRANGMEDDSHDARDLTGLFDSFPKTDLLAGREEDVGIALFGILEAERSGQPRVFAWTGDDPDAGVFVTIVVPASRFSSDLAEQIREQLTKDLAASVLHEQGVFDDRPAARLHYHLLLPAARADASLAAHLEQTLDVVLHTWKDRLAAELERTRSPGEAQRLAAIYARALPPAYRAEASPRRAAADVERLERLAADGRERFDLRPDAGGSAALHVYRAGPRLELSDFVPLLEDLGLHVVSESETRVCLSGVDSARIHAFCVRPARDSPELTQAGDRLTDTLRAVRQGVVPGDRLNALVLHAGLDWRQVDLLRAYREHARQCAVAPAQTITRLLNGHPTCARLLFEWFAARFDPDREPNSREEAEPGTVEEKAFRESLAGVSMLADDRVLRALGTAVRATVRTNFYSRTGENSTDEALALKIDGDQLTHLPAARPRWEIYTHGPTLEGVHLRAGLIARGGIRYSERNDDFRAEIAELMQTQTLKNSLIVPVGAKGGFVLTQRSAATADPADVESVYRTFIASLLSVTDNRENGVVVPPPRQVSYGVADPYLVVAADRGTGTFSDAANEVADRYGYWAGDAFASGGTNGYDHKRLAITARGAWESVRRHFHVLGRDADRERLSVAGIGDMGGDVFGNGMLLSRHLLLRAAFNHRHIFLDPSPDPERSFAERQRLFAMPGSSWADYADEALGPGGGIYPRAAKALPLSPEAREMLGLEDVEPDGESVVRAILRLNVDLLWNGGVGTYVKASDETHAAAADPANDAVRVDARDLRVRVVAEGGNLGFTQRARVEFALAGGRINTDAIDNCAGVHLSDREVNLKIALQPGVAAREMSLDARNALLHEAAEEVCEAVLRENRSQAVLLELEQQRSRLDLRSFRCHIADLAARGAVNPELASLPDRDTLRARRGVFLGLTHPELATLLAATRLDLRHALLASERLDDPAFGEFLTAYFPAVMHQKAARRIEAHPLRREIIAVCVSNELVDSMGITFAGNLSACCGRPIEDVVAAWVVAYLAGEADRLVAQLDTETSEQTASAEAAARLCLAAGLGRAVAWVVQTCAPEEATVDILGRLAPGARRLLAGWTDLPGHGRASRYRGIFAHLRDAGIAEELASSLATLDALADALAIVHLASQREEDEADVAAALFAAGEIIEFPAVLAALEVLGAGAGRAEQRAVHGLHQTLVRVRSALTAGILDCREDDAEAFLWAQRYREAHSSQIDRLRSALDDLRGAHRPTLAGVLVVLQEMERLEFPG